MLLSYSSKSKTICAPQVLPCNATTDKVELRLMDRACWIIITLTSVLLVSLWGLLNRPDYVPVWPDSIEGVSFSPFRAHQSPETTTYPTTQQIWQDLKLLVGNVENVRTYSVADSLASVPFLAKSLGIDTTVGIWISDDTEQNRREIDRFKTYFDSYASNVTGIIVGNEVLLRQELEVLELIDYIQEIKQHVGGIPVSTAETWDNWLKFPELVDHVDYLTIHVLPYWEGIPNGIAHEYVVERFQQLQQEYSGKPMIIGEVGWPSEGRQRGGAVPSVQNQAKFLRRFLYEAELNRIPYFVLEAFDQVWKTNEGTVGRYWGIYNTKREAKFPFNAPVTPVADWPAIVGFSLAFAILILAVLLRDSRGLVHKGRGFLVLVSYLISSVVVWLVYDYSTKYLTGEQIAVSIGLLIAACCIGIVLLAEAHEWAESLWGNGRRSQSLKPLGDNDPQPMVSIHVPIYNEPPEMVIETLNALRKLDYNNFEVIVVDNNTKSKSTWQPVQAWCQQFPALFRFYHVDPLPGFKAGALNYALSKTDKNAEFISVIDSDYTVERNWLRECMSGFENPDVAIVQAPQDYRDSDESAFKAMIYSEYAGFFGIGMVNRNVRNAIIQHGTMTIIRRSTLKEVSGWSQWCITEDAELGLRILADGKRAIYVAKSYGKGLMPDNFTDYKKQRFRWAYGSVLIMRHHISRFLGLKKSKLSSGQRYHFIAGWLPWIADGFCLLFNFVALVYAIMMLYFPYRFAPPEVLLCSLPIGFFVFKLLKMQVLYRNRLKASLRQSLAAGIAGLAVSHTISRAMLAGVYTKDIAFFRTPKKADNHNWIQALHDAREELLLATALLLAAFYMTQRYDFYLLDTQLWTTLLVVQSVPYLSAVAVSLVSSYAQLPARIFQQTTDRSLLPTLQSNDAIPTSEWRPSMQR